MIKIIVSIWVVFLFFGCDDTQEQSYIQGEKKPTLESFVIMNVDENITQAKNSFIGSIPVESFGAGAIDRFEASGTGSKSLLFLQSGAIYPADGGVFGCTKQGVYDLKVKAYNNYGASNPARLYLQVNCLDVPLPYDKKITLNQGENRNDSLSFKRKGATPSETIKDVMLYSADGTFLPLGKSVEGINIDQYGAISINSCQLSKQKYNFLVKAINSQGKISPFGHLDIVINPVDYNPCDNQDPYIPPTNPNDPDNPDGSLPVYSDDDPIYKGGVIDDTYPWSYAMNLSQDKIKTLNVVVNSGYIYVDGMLFDTSKVLLKRYAQGYHTANISGENGSSYNVEITTKYDDVPESGYYELQTNMYNNAIETTDDVDTFRYDATSQNLGTNVVIASTDGDLFFKAELLDENMNQLDINSGNNVEFDVSQKAIYYIKISSLNSTIGGYGITFIVQ